MGDGHAVLVALGVALVVASISLPLLIRYAHRRGLLDRPGRHKRHDRPTPFLGGVALFLAVWAAIATSAWLCPAGEGLDTGTIWLLFAGAVVITVLGVIDDLRPLPAWPKLIVQVGLGLWLYFGGLRVEYLVWPSGEVQLGDISLLITVGWVVVVTNAINLIDGLDGLAGGVSLIACASLILIGSLQQVGWVLVILVALAGFLIPFMYYNRYPARIFLGDSGSLQIGYYFAVFSLVVNFKSFAASALFLPLLALGVPLIEIASSFSRRAMSGRGVMTADRRHLFHYLSLAGWSPRRVVTTFYLLGIVFGLFALAMLYWNKLVVISVLIIFTIVVVVAFAIFASRLPDRLRDNRRADRSGDPGV